MRDTRIEVLHNPYAMGYILRYGKRDPEGNWWIATDPTFIQIKPGMPAPKAVLDITPEEAQDLFDCLWNMGYRPSSKRERHQGRVGSRGAAPGGHADPGAQEGDSIFGMRVVKPCPYCRRREQKPDRKSCDGCGAPRG